MKDAVEKFIVFMKDIKHSSENTVSSYKRDLMKMCEYMNKQNINSVEKITLTNLNAYILYLEKIDYSTTTITRYIASIKAFFRYLFQMKMIDENPSISLKGPEIEKKNPTMLSVKEVELILNEPSKDTPKEVRDKAMLELLYATGMRVSELINVKIDDVNVNLNYVICTDNKKERIIPFGNATKEALEKYIKDVRNILLGGNESKFLFLNCKGSNMSRQGFWKIIKYYGRRAGIEREITPHAIRHSFGYHLVSNGASLYAVKEMMGHSTVTTTQMYTGAKHGGINEEYFKAHPRK